MQKQILFYREYTGLWYAHVAGHTKEESIMVGKANEILDKIFEVEPKQFTSFLDIGSISRHPICCLSVDPSTKLVDLHPKSKIGLGSFDIDCDEDYLILELSNHNGYGATYFIQNTAMARKYGIAKTEVWLCNVVHTVFGEHPKVMTVVPSRYANPNWEIL